MSLTVRASSLSSWFDCPRRWAARQMGPLLKDLGYDVRSLPSSIGAVVGSGTHAAVAHDLEHKMEHGRLADWSEVEGRGETELLERMQQEGVAWDEVTPSLSDAQMTVRRLARQYRRDVGETVKPVAVERRIKAKHHTGIILSGQQDVVVSDPSTLRDLKTGKNRSANWSQYGSYTLLLRSHAMAVLKIIEDYLQRVALSKDQPPVRHVIYDLAACEAQTERTLKSIATTMAEFDRRQDLDVFTPNPSSYLCSDKFCPLHGTDSCVYGRTK